MAKTFVLVHGICHGGWAWNPVATLLRAQGHAVYTPTMPGLGADDARADVHLVDTVDYLVEYIEQRNLTNVVLVGHSWGGFLVSGASQRIPDRVERLVYWSAFVPHTGESLIDLCPPEFGEMFRSSAHASSDNSVTFPADVFAAALMQDASPETQRVFHSLLARQPFHTMNESLNLDEWQRLRLPATYIVTDDDISLPAGDLGWAPRFPDRLSDGHVISTRGSHEALITEPESLAHAFVRASEGR
ncbi:alpha/beta hydrolase [Rhodococcoides fascians A21d2]|uniref:alpha/beta fold hydrolase n=1 Tax=Rhodococcoides fascians TaxID=1828 RepID=UPI00055AA032|nr:alpha/beta fold hydrolase [Rhodococcus fascians]QII01463.1 alpha/beta hydrolase [Rhodococcus fascians A21d2]